MRKLNVAIVAGVIAALVGVGIVVAYGRGVNSRIAAGRRTTTVLVARQPLPAGVPASGLAGVVVEKKVPVAYTVTGALDSLAQVPAGSVLLGPVAAGGQLSYADFGSSSIPAAVQPIRGTVDVAISVGLTPGVLKYVQPGSDVDIFVTYTQAGSSAGSSAGAAGLSSATKLFATDVPVVSVSAASPPAGQSGSTATPAATINPSDVYAVLQVPPGLAQQIVNAATLGDIYLALAPKGNPELTRAATVPSMVLSGKP